MINFERYRQQTVEQHVAQEALVAWAANSTTVINTLRIEKNVRDHEVAIRGAGIEYEAGLTGGCGISNTTTEISRWQVTL
jgi:hypothetical protein